MEADIAAGRDMMKDKDAPGFLQETVDQLENRWTNTERRAKDRYLKLKVSHTLKILFFFQESFL